MLSFAKKIIRFAVARKAYRGIARGVGFRTLAGVIGLVGGIHAMRKR